MASALIPRSFTGIFDDLFHNAFHFEDRAESFAPVNIKESEKSYEVEVIAPGLKKEGFKVQVDRNVLRISYENKESRESTDEQNGKWVRKEYRFASFSRSFTLNDKINAANITATYQDGILKVNLPKKELTEPTVQQITVG